MEKREMIMEVIEDLGYKPSVDEDGDVCMRFQLKRVFFLIGDDDEQYISAVMPQFCDIDEGEETLALAVCNILTRDLKLAKVFVDHTLKSVSAGCDFFYTDMESLKNNVEQVLRILGMVRTAYKNKKAEMAN